MLDAAALAGHLVPAGSMFAFLAAHRAGVFPDAGYADLFSPPGVGRPSSPATQMAAVLTLQVLHDYPDRETAGAVKFGVRWKVAIGASLDDPGFDPSSLVYWRKRLARSQRPRRVSGAVRKIVGQTGIVEGPAAAGGGLRHLGGCGSHPGHRDPAGPGDPPTGSAVGRPAYGPRGPQRGCLGCGRRAGTSAGRWPISQVWKYQNPSALQRPSMIRLSAPHIA